MVRAASSHNCGLGNDRWAERWCLDQPREATPHGDLQTDAGHVIGRRRLKQPAVTPVALELVRRLCDGFGLAPRYLLSTR